MGKMKVAWGNERGLIDYSFPLQTGLVAELYLPASGLEPDDARRLKDYIDTLVIDRSGEVS